MTDGLFARVERLFDVEAFRDLWVLIAGCGSGGGQVALQLVMSGVRKFILVDMDKLEVENVIRHVCGLRYVGWRKTAALADVLRDRNPEVEIRAFDEDVLEWPGLEDEIERASVVVIGTDNEPSRYRLNEACVKAGDAVHGRARVHPRYRWRGIRLPTWKRRMPGLPGGVAGTHPVPGGGARDRPRNGGGAPEDVRPRDRRDQGLAGPVGGHRLHCGVPHAADAGRARGDAAEERPKFMTPLKQNYFVWGNRAVHPFSRNFELQRMSLQPQEGCMVCGAQV